MQFVLVVLSSYAIEDEFIHENVVLNMNPGL